MLSFHWLSLLVASSLVLNGLAAPYGSSEIHARAPKVELHDLELSLGKKIADATGYEEYSVRGQYKGKSNLLARVFPAQNQNFDKEIKATNGIGQYVDSGMVKQLQKPAVIVEPINSEPVFAPLAPLDVEVGKPMGQDGPGKSYQEYSVKEYEGKSDLLLRVFPTQNINFHNEIISANRIQGMYVASGMVKKLEKPGVLIKPIRLEGRADLQ
ncbi:hypothetical protein BDP27DRAFT_1339857 [Rhodocollybia butyracea]|uniref:Uncharacterized protein n=1 Tax=Rhodocollybia butyracea TaxID=206335 RepID=A0A9P5PB96_9AGAR|nr:hypothetical protein BDP27DRAFT_1339857 [Rhodocollybia butyracea]